MSYITAIGTANPANRYSQSRIAAFMHRSMQFSNGEERKLKAVFRASGIAYRHSVLEDYGRLEGYTFYPDTADLEPFPTTAKRLEVFRTHALSLSLASVDDMLQDSPQFHIERVTHLIMVCCTGMYAPGLDIDLVNSLGLSPSVSRTAINFMGCHASFNALKVADAFCKSDPDAKVLIVCTELCTIHFQRIATDDNILANALFADGAAAVLVEAETENPMRLVLEQYHSVLAREGARDMAWTIGDLGFEMRLSSYVPDLISDGIGELMTRLLTKGGITRSQLAHYAIHPGGKKILEVAEQALEITRHQNAAAYHVLKNYGNMSSPTVLFVLKEVVRKLNDSNHGERILGLAFGPGLTLESMILRIDRP